MRGIIVSIDDEKKPYLVKYLLPLIDRSKGGVIAGKRYRKKDLKALE